MNIGNDRRVPVAAITQPLAWVGDPRTLTALNCLDDVAPDSARKDSP